MANITVVILALMQDLVVDRIHDVAKNTALDIIDEAVGNTIDFVGLQRTLLFVKLPANLICNFLVLWIDEVHSVVVAVHDVRDDIFLHQKAFCFIQHLFLGDFLIFLASNETP